jgi:DNA-binding transcriptional ArsR family regulator
MIDQSTSLGAVFQALSSDVRRLVLDRLRAGSLTVSQVAAPLDMSLAAVSKHLQVLERAGLITVSIQGRRHVCSMVSGSLQAAREWLDLSRVRSDAATELQRPAAPRWQRPTSADEEID